MKMISMLVMILILASSYPVYAWHYHPCYRYGYGYGAAIGAAGGVGLLAGLLIGAAIVSRMNQPQKMMLDSAARQNRYDGYLSAMSVYNAQTKQPISIMQQNEWEQWRKIKGLDILK